MKRVVVFWFLVFLPFAASAGRYELIKGQGVEVCEAYLKNINLSILYASTKYSIAAGRFSYDKCKKAKLCNWVSHLISVGSIKRYYIDAVPASEGERMSYYNHIDLDGDGVSEAITVSSGSSGSFLHILLSGGGVLELESGFIRLLKMNGKVYALATFWQTQHEVPVLYGYRLYLIDKNGAVMVCDFKDIKGDVK